MTRALAGAAFAFRLVIGCVALYACGVLTFLAIDPATVALAIAAGVFSLLTFGAAVRGATA